MGIIDIFIEREEKKPKGKPEPKVEQAPTPQPVQSNYVPASGSPAIEEMQKHFDKLVEVSNFPGNDLYEFKKMKDAIPNSVLEETKYVIAFSGLAANGLSKDHLVKTANDYIAIIEKELVDFESHYQQTFDIEVTKVKQTVEAKAKEMQELSQRIQALSQEHAELNNKIIQNESKLQASRSNFLMAGENKKRELQEEINKINTYIKTT